MDVQAVIYRWHGILVPRLFSFREKSLGTRMVAWVA
jgi:hypothetical protein